MVRQIFLVLILQLVFFTFYYKFGFKVASIIGRRVCPVCFTVGSAWLTLLILRYTGVFPINKFLIALLLAESVVGVSYLVEEFMLVRQTKLSEPVLKLGIIIYGTLAVSIFSFFNDLFGLILFAPVITFGFLSLTPIQKPEKPKKQESSILESKLKNCC